MNPKPTLLVTSDFTEQFNAIVKKFRRDEVLVGIPSSGDARDDGPIGNAAILAINDFGSAANNIPARPVMAIGIRKAQDEIAEQFKRAAVQALSGGAGEVSAAYSRAGIVASNSIKKVINDQDGIAPPSPATIDARTAKGFKGTKALIVTAQMRNAITWVLRDG